jgi:integrase
VGAAKSRATLRAYRTDWAHFETWCAAHGADALPASPETVALYLTDLAAVARPSTLQRRVSSISQAHQAAGFDSPTRDALVRTTLTGIRRTLGTAPVQKSPALTADVRAMVEALPDTLAGARDRALLLLGFAAALRRSELVGLDVDDVVEQHEGLVVTVRRSKTDQEAVGRRVGVPYGSNPATCPVRAVRAWRDATGIEDGPLFRPVDRHGRVRDARLSGTAVALIVKRAAARAGLDAHLFAGHSLRAGLATSAAAAGASERAIMAQTGHKSLPMVRSYIREGSLFRENAAATVGL